MKADLEASKAKASAISNPIGVQGLPNITSLSQQDELPNILKQRRQAAVGSENRKKDPMEDYD